MIYKKLKEIYNVDTISQEKGWRTVREAVEKVGEDIEIDFTGINVVEPWLCAEFKALLKNENVHMRFVNSKAIVDGIHVVCVLEGIDYNRIRNVVVEVPKQKTPEERKIETNGKELVRYFHVDTDKNLAVLRVGDRYTQLYNTSTLDYVEYAINLVHNDNGINHFIINVVNVATQESVLSVIADMIVKYNKEGIVIELESEDKEVLDKLSLYLHKATRKPLSSMDRYKALLTKVKPGTVGLLIKYRKSKAKDDFGREGKGEVISCRPAIFRGMTQGKSSTVVKIDTYNNDFFYTKIHWMVEHDNELPDELSCDNLEINISELGFANEFLGSRYHFIPPIQRDINDNSVVITGLDESGKNIRHDCILPERMKLVFDSWGVKYDKDELNRVIEENKALLDKLQSNPAATIEGLDVEQN